VRFTKTSPEFECQGQRSKIMVSEDKKNEKVRYFVGSGPRGARSSTPVGKSAHAVLLID